MRKSTSLALISLAIFSILPMISASALFGQTTSTLNLFEKNPSNWSIVNGGAYGVVKFTTVSTPWTIIQERASVMAFNLQPKTEYQLIYYGNSEFNDVWNYATCIGNPIRTSTQGYFNSGSSKFNHLDMQNDNINQKIWVVLARDVDCNDGRMIAWNPTEYLFEGNTI